MKIPVIHNSIFPGDKNNKIVRQSRRVFTYFKPSFNLYFHKKYRNIVHPAPFFR
jgi:hypothetical protein